MSDSGRFDQLYTVFSADISRSGMKHFLNIPDVSRGFLALHTQACTLIALLIMAQLMIGSVYQIYWHDRTLRHMSDIEQMTGVLMAALAVSSPELQSRADGSCMLTEREGRAHLVGYLPQAAVIGSCTRGGQKILMLQSAWGIFYIPHLIW